MKGSRFSEEQIIGVLKEAEAGVPVKSGHERGDVLSLESEIRGMEVNEARRLRQLEDENSRLKKIVAQQALDIDALKVVLAKKW
jgi:putative transposase